MRKPPGVITVGTAKDLAMAGVGYTASGASEHSRQSAHPTNTKLNGFVAPRVPLWAMARTEGELIAKNARQIAALSMRMRFEKDPERLAKMREKIEIKRRMIAKLEADRRRK